MDRALVNQWQPELMSSEERGQYVNSAFDRACQGKRITIQTNSQLVLSPGTYQWDPASLGAVLGYQNPINLQNWQLGFGGTFVLSTPQIIRETGGTTDAILNYFPDKEGPGVPLIRQVIGAGIAALIRFPFAGNWSLVHTTAAGAFIRAFNGAGYAEFIYLVGAGDIVTLSQTALL